MEEKKSWGVLLGLGTIALSVPYMLLKVVNAACNLRRLGKLQEKVVVITGASSGIGEALAHVFYKKGCRVVLCARRVEELERVKTDLLQQHSTVPTHLPIVVPLDLSDLQTFDKVVKSIIDITGHIDLLINNGGISNRGFVQDTNVDVFVKIMTVNFLGTVAFTKAILPHMLEHRQGHIVFMSSVQGLISIPSRAAYAASKHAIQGFADSLRAEVAEYKIFVTVVSPGYVKTELSLNALTGTGSQHGQMDDNTAKGYTAEYVAEQTCLAVAQRKNELLIAPFIHLIGIFLRRNLPQIYFYAMSKRARRTV